MTGLRGLRFRWTMWPLWLLAYGSLLLAVDGQTSAPSVRPTVAPTRVSCSTSGYPSPYAIASNAVQLDDVLVAWTSSGCDGVVVFTSAGARLPLLRSHSVVGHRLHLDASGLSTGITLVAPPAARHFAISGGTGNLTASAISFVNGRVSSTSGDSGGGALLFSSGAHGMFARCVFRNNTATSTATAQGGAVHSLGAGQLRFQDCVWRGNAAVASVTARGGAIHAEGNTTRLAITTSSFSDNQVLGRWSQVAAASGGALSIAGGSASITRTNFSGNSVTVGGSGTSLTCAGGGLSSRLTSLVLLRSNVTGNQVSCTATSGSASLSVYGLGGGLSASGSEVVVNSSTVSGNRVQLWGGAAGARGYAFGGGMHLAGGAVLRASGVAVLGNRAMSNHTALGGGLYSTGGGLTLLVCRISFNFAQARFEVQGGGSFVSIGASNVMLQSVTVANNTAKAGVSVIGGGMSINARRSVLTRVVVVDNSASIRNTSRSSTGSGSAVAYGGGLSIAGGGSVMTLSTVRANMARVIDSSADTIKAFGGGLYVTCAASSSGLTVTGNRAWASGWSNASSIYAIGGGVYHTAMTFYNLTNISSNTAAQGGSGDSATTYAAGGGVFVSSMLNSSWLEVSGNRVESVYTGYGGGLRLGSAAQRLSNFRVSGNVVLANSMYYGGGLSIGSAKGVSLKDGVVSNNFVRGTNGSTVYTYGGGMHLASAGTTIMERLVVSSNRALIAWSAGDTFQAYGGGVFSTGFALTIRNCSVTGNFLLVTSKTMATAVAARGGGVCHTGSLVVDSALLKGNWVVQQGRATAASWIGGGGLYIGPSSAFTGSGMVVTANVMITTFLTAAGGGVSSLGSSFVLSASTVADNRIQAGSTAQGGGLRLSISTTSTATITGAVIRNNTVLLVSRGALTSYIAAGGGIQVATGRSVLLKNVTVSGNLALMRCGVNGARVFASGGGVESAVALTLVGCNLTSNSASSIVSSTSSIPFGSGGAVAVSADLTINQTMCRSNQVYSGGGRSHSSLASRGGALFMSTASFFVGDGLTLSRNRVTSLALAASGGAMHLNATSIIVLGSLVATNWAQGGTEGYGGGLTLLSRSRSIVLQRSSFSNNTASASGSSAVGAYGGGVSLQLPWFTTTEASLHQLTICNNTAAVSGAAAAVSLGGGLHVPQAKSVRISGSLICGNRATLSSTTAVRAMGLGGGIYTAASMVLTDVELRRNRASVAAASAATVAQAGGGALHAIGSTVNLTACTISSNSAVQSGGAGASTSYAIGGGIALNGTCRLRTSGALTTFTANQVSSAALPLGGALYIGRTAVSLLLSALVVPHSGLSPTSVVINTVYGDAGGVGIQPSTFPTFMPTGAPTVVPTQRPTQLPTKVPTTPPTLIPTTFPTAGPTTLAPTTLPTTSPTRPPTTLPTLTPTSLPTQVPTRPPTTLPTLSPTTLPTTSPTRYPTKIPTLAPTRLPSNTPTRLPTRSPTDAPTTFPTGSPISLENASLPLVIGVTGAQYGPQNVLLINPLGELQLHGRSNRPGTYNWTSDNGTVSCMVATGPYLVIPAGCLLLDNGYAFTVRLTQTSGQWTTKQISVMLNRGPLGGNFSVEPAQGMALQTVFHLKCLGWLDPEEHYPLAFRWQQQLVNRRVDLCDWQNQSTLNTFLLSGANVTLQGAVADRFGASSLSASHPVNVTAMTKSGLLAALNSMLAIAGGLGSSNLNGTIARTSLLLGAEAARTSSSGAMTTLVLDLLSAVTSRSGNLDGSSTSSIIDTLAALAQNISASQADELLRVSANLLNRTETIDRDAGQALLNAASAALAASASAAGRASYELILQGLTGAAVKRLAPGSTPWTLGAMKTVLRVSVIYVLPYRPFLVSLEPNAKTTFLLPAALLASLHPRLCGALLVAKVTQISTGADARPFLNSTTPLSSNLTVLEFGTVCGNQISMIALSDLPVPVMASMPVALKSAPLQRYAMCPVGRLHKSLEMACMYSSARNASVGIECDGTQGRWVFHGRNSLPVAIPHEATLRCDIDRLGVFSAVTDPVETVRLSRQGNTEFEPDPIEKSYGLVIAVAVLYAILLLGLVVVRCRRTRESSAYLRRMPYTRMFQTVTSSILHRAPPGTPADEKIDSEDEQPLAEIIASIINTRLRKLVGLRTGIRRLPLARRTLKTAPHAPANSELAQAEALRPPITRLNSHQNFIMTSIRIATQVLLAILTSGPDTASVKDLASLLLLARPDLTAVWAIMVAAVQQNLITELISRVLELLLYMANRETRVQKSMADHLVELDLPLVVPKPREASGALCVPLLRISLLQLELVQQVVEDGDLVLKKQETEEDASAAEKTMHKQARVWLTQDERVALIPMLKLRIDAVKKMLQQEYHSKMSELAQAEGKCSMSRLQGPADFRENPLAHFEKESQLSVSFDKWIVSELYYRPIADLGTRVYYNFFVAEPSELSNNHVRSLFSWRLLLIDLILILYLTCLFVASITLGANVTTATVMNAFIYLVGGMALNYFVFSPCLTVLQGALTWRVVIDIYEMVKHTQPAFKIYCRPVTETETYQMATAATLAPFANETEAMQTFQQDLADLTQAQEADVYADKPVIGSDGDAVYAVDSDGEPELWDHAQWVEEATKAAVQPTKTIKQKGRAHPALWGHQNRDQWIEVEPAPGEATWRDGTRREDSSGSDNGLSETGLSPRSARGPGDSRRRRYSHRGSSKSIVQPMDSTKQLRHAPPAKSGAEPPDDGFGEVEGEAPANLKASRSSTIMVGGDMSDADAVPQSAKGSRRSQSLRHASFGGAKAVVQLKRHKGHDHLPLTDNRGLEQEEAHAEPSTWPEEMVEEDISDADDAPRRSPDKSPAPAFNSRTSRSSKSLRHASVSRQQEEEGDRAQSRSNPRQSSSIRRSLNPERTAEEAATNQGTAEVDAHGVNHEAPMDLAQAIAAKRRAKRLRKQHQHSPRQAQDAQVVQQGEDIEEETL